MCFIHTTRDLSKAKPDEGVVPVTPCPTLTCVAVHNLSHRVVFTAQTCYCNTLTAFIGKESNLFYRRKQKRICRNKLRPHNCDIFSATI